MTAAKTKNAPVETAEDVIKTESLRQIARRITAEVDAADPAVLANRVIAELTDEQCRDALAVCMPNWLRNFVGQTGRAVRAEPRQRPMTSPDRIRNWYSRMLSERMFVGSEWKFLADCTSDDLHAAAAERYRKASETHAEGDRWTKVALFMEEHGRSTVDKIMPDELKRLMEAK